MANFGGPDAASAGLVVQAYEKRAARKQADKELMVNSLFKGAALVQGAQELELKKAKDIRDAELDSKRLEKEIVELNIKNRELVVANSAGTFFKIISDGIKNGGDFFKKWSALQAAAAAEEQSKKGTP